MNISIILALGITILVVVVIFKTAKIVPQREQYVIERLGKYSRTLDAGFHILIPFLDIVAYRHTMKERAINISSQACITKDNITVIVDGVLYIQVLNAKAASYGIEDYQFATTQLAQTTMRSEIGKIELDKTFEEREMINNQIVTVLDKAASENWGLKVLRYEIKDIEPPESVKDALEKQMRAERERRAVVAESEGEKQAKINVSEGERQEIINLSEAEKKKQINEAEGKAEEIKLVANATAEGIKNIAEAINEEGGVNAVNLRVAEQYIEEFGKLAKESNTLIIPSTLSDVGAMVGAFMETIKAIKPEPSGGKNS
ncbi:MAG: paraslipin [Gammaproteobacteria bacterium]|nr:paraslipin [Gammaproteobacteria bacterium]MCY4283627.1 paraslipin [Gammaproteobacteria bacterium]